MDVATASEVAPSQGRSDDCRWGRGSQSRNATMHSAQYFVADFIEQYVALDRTRLTHRVVLTSSCERTLSLIHHTTPECSHVAPGCVVLSARGREGNANNVGVIG